MIIYLDQNKWIDLAKTIIKPNENTKYKDVANLILDRSNSGEWIFPISIIHYLETLSRRNPDSRTRLAKVIAKIAKRNALSPFHIVQKDEFYIAFSKIHQPSNIPKINAVQDNYFSALGSEPPKVEFDKNNPHYSAELHEEIENFAENLFSKPDLFELFMSMINNDQEIIDDLHKDDVDTKKEWEKWRAVYTAIDKQHRYSAFLVRFFFDHFIQYRDDLMSIFGKNRETIIPPEILDDRDRAADFFESIPSMDVRVKLMYETLNNQSKEIDLHDHRDIGFLATAIPYCDVVITEKVWKHYSNQRKLSSKYNTAIENDLNYLLTFE